MRLYHAGTASPRKDRLPATYSPSLFCHTCQTNQTLVSNLLANYLPPPHVCTQFIFVSPLVSSSRGSIRNMLDCQSNSPRTVHLSKLAIHRHAQIACLQSRKKFESVMQWHAHRQLVHFCKRARGRGRHARDRVLAHIHKSREQLWKKSFPCGE